jgi:hypothetical protein
VIVTIVIIGAIAVKTLIIRGTGIVCPTTRIKFLIESQVIITLTAEQLDLVEIQRLTAGGG